MHFNRVLDFWVLQVEVNFTLPNLPLTIRWHVKFNPLEWKVRVVVKIGSWNALLL